jgi:hypothetical protein
VCGDAAEFFDPRSPESILQAIARIRADAGRRAELIERGKRRLQARSMTWDEITAGIVKQLEALSPHPVAVT